jgi:signal peptidase I
VALHRRYLSPTESSVKRRAARYDARRRMRGQNFKFLGIVIIVIAAIVAVLKTWYVDVVVVGHDAMAPTLIAGDTVLVWRGSEAEHGAVMLCHHPTIDARYVIGRVVGRNGADLTVDRGRLRIEGSFPENQWSGTVQFRDPSGRFQQPMRWGHEQLGNDFHLIFMREGGELRMRPIANYDGLYLLDDNRTYVGEDSREFGPVPESRCIGRVFMRVAMSEATPPEIENRRFQIIQ